MVSPAVNVWVINRPALRLVVELTKSSAICAPSTNTSAVRLWFAASWKRSCSLYCCPAVRAVAVTSTSSGPGTEFGSLSSWLQRIVRVIASRLLSSVLVP